MAIKQSPLLHWRLLRNDYAVLSESEWNRGGFPPLLPDWSHVMALRLTDDLKNSIYDGMFANAFATLTGGVFLTGFALYLGMNEFMIGLVAAMPFMVTVFQLPVADLA